MGLKRQPRKGETAFRCLCAPSSGKADWFEFKPPLQFAREDLSTGVASWLALCEVCRRHFDGTLPRNIEDYVLPFDLVIEEGGLDA